LSGKIAAGTTAQPLPEDDGVLSFEMDRMAVETSPLGRRFRRKSPQINSRTLEALEQRRLLAAAPVIDVMVLYTPRAAQQAGGTAAITPRITRAISDTNLALANSQINASVRLVHEEQVSYTESGQLHTDLLNLQQGTGTLSQVAGLRQKYGADLVSLWTGTEAGTEAGEAFQPDSTATAQAQSGFNVVEAKYAVDDYVFAHEVGHNLGAGHDRSDFSPRAIPYAYGKTFYEGNYFVGDIMNDAGADRIPYYSNPNVSFQGIPTGNPDNSAQPADNARVMSQFAPIVANYEPSVVPDTIGPTAAILGVVVNPAQQTLMFKIGYADDTAVNVSSFKTGNITVTGPNGFSKVATYLGDDFSSDGPQRVATYQVSIAGNSTDPTAYSFNLLTGAVTDIYGHGSTDNTLGAPQSRFPNRAGPRLATACDIGVMNGLSLRFNNWIDSNDPTAFYEFIVTNPEQFTAHLSGLSGQIDELLVQDRNSDGIIQSNEILSYPRRTGTTPETISLTLSPGTYYVWVAPPALGATSSCTLTMSAAPLSPPPPVLLQGTISGNVFNDLNANGMRDAGDLGLAGWQVYADLNGNGRLDPGEPTTITDAQGNYTLANLAAGAYIIRALPRTGWRQTTPANNYGQHLTLGTGQTWSNANFGETQQNQIRGVVYNDWNGDGIHENGEAGLAGWTVYIDTDNNGILDSADRVATTDYYGNFSFINVPAGTYTLRAVAPQSRWHPTNPITGSFRITIASGQVISLAFGERWV
jgi:hypothetical protein